MVTSHASSGDTVGGGGGGGGGGDGGGGGGGGGGAHDLNGAKGEDVSHLRGRGCYLRLCAQPSHGQLELVDSRLFSSAGFTNVVSRPAAELKSVDNGRHLFRDRVFW
ncbi:hypothetical protein SprV_0401410000 [Sparganum proliferum]